MYLVLPDIEFTTISSFASFLTFRAYLRMLVSVRISSVSFSCSLRSSSIGFVTLDSPVPPASYSESFEMSRPLVKCILSLVCL